MRKLNPLRMLLRMLFAKKPAEQTFYHPTDEMKVPFELNQCTNGSVRCMLPLKCYDAERCLHNG